VGDGVNGLRIARGFRLPVDVAGEAIALLGKRGAGKTNTGKVLVEEVYRAGVQVVVLDPMGVWWALRAGADGDVKGGLPIAVLGGQHGDVPLEAAAGALIADVGVETNQSLVLDLSDFSKTEQRRFVADFATRFYREKGKKPGSVLVALEEADEFAPQRVTSGDAPMVGAISLLMKRGRSRGIGMVVITQRSASLNKDVLDQADTLIVMRTFGPRDRKAIDSWVEHQDADGVDEIVPSLPTLATGEAWVWSPVRAILKRVKVRKADREIDLAALGEQIAATAERAAQNDPAALRRRITKLERELAVRPTEEKVVERVEQVEVPMLADRDLERVEKIVERIEKVAERHSEAYEALREVMFPLAANVKAGLDRRVAPPPVPPRPAERLPVQVEPRPRTPIGNGDVRLNRKAERMVLAVLAQHPEGRTKRQVAIQAGYAQRGGGFNGALSKLRAAGFIEGSNHLRITEHGFTAIEGQWEPLPSGRALLDHWLRQFNRAAERAVLQVTYDAYPDVLSKEEIAERAGYEAAGGGFNGALSKSRTLGLIEKHGDSFRASDEFFEEG
jgi:uncharacterized protein